MSTCSPLHSWYRLPQIHRRTEEGGGRGEANDQIIYLQHMQNLPGIAAISEAVQRFFAARPGHIEAAGEWANGLIW